MGFRLAYDYNHEGIRVRSGCTGDSRLTVIAQFDADSTSSRIAAEVREALTSAGYACSEFYGHAANIFHVAIDKFI